MRPDKIGQTLKVRDKLIVPQSGITHRPAAASVYFGGFNKYKPCTSSREPTDIHEMPIRWESILRRILMHRRHHNAVLHCDVANGHRRK